VTLEEVICLFDVDGVLVQPGGYRAAVKGTLDYFLTKMDLAQYKPGDEIPVLFESFGVTSEWDMVPITLAVILEAVSTAIRGEQTPNTLREFTTWEKIRRFDQKIDLQAGIRDLAPAFLHAEIPSEAILERALSHTGSQPLAHLSTSLLTELFGHTRSVAHSEITRVFQTFVLGSNAFSTVYDMAPPFESGSFLEEYDRLLIEPTIYQRLKEAKGAEKFHYAAYTARPSLPPKGAGVNIPGYSPEAEQGLGLVDPQLMPMIGYGRLVYLAEQIGIKADTILKPAPLQALAAMAAACCEDEWASLSWALEVFARYSDGKVSALPGNYGLELIDCLPETISMHVFEDSSIGITAAKRAAELLKKEGVEIQLHAWGIAVEEEKRQALAAVGASVLPDVNAALREAFTWID
jgi:predicted esterase